MQVILYECEHIQAQHVIILPAPAGVFKKSHPTFTVHEGLSRNQEIFRDSFVVGIFSVHLYTSPSFGGLEKTLPSFLKHEMCHVTSLGHRIMNNMSHFRLRQ